MKQGNAPPDWAEDVGSTFPLKSPIIFSIIISIIVLAVFSAVLSDDFVMWDDDISVYQNPHLGRLSLARVYFAFTDTDVTMRYNPLAFLSWSLSYHLFGLNPFGYHLIDWLLHGLSSGVLFLIIRKVLLLSPLRLQASAHNFYVNITASLATLCWALHPMRVESVAWATDRTYGQAVFFLLLSTLCYLKAIDSESDRRQYLFLIISAFVWYAVSLLSHAIGTTYCAVFLLFDVFLFKRIGNSIGWWRSPAARKVLLEKIPLAVPAVLIGVISLVARVRSAGYEPPVPLSAFGIVARLMQASYVTVYYLYRPFYPVDLAPVYSTLVSFDPLSLPFLLRAVGLLALSVGIFLFRKRWPIGVALLLAHIILLFPVMGFLEHPHYHADRYSLVSSMCLSILIAFAVIHAMRSKYVAMIVVVGLLIGINVLGWLTFKQIKVWYGSETLFSHAIETLKGDPYRQDLYWRLGKYLFVNGKEEQAAVNFEKTLAIDPYHPIARSYLAQIEYDKGNLAGAAYHLQKILVADPNNAKARYELSELLKKLKK